MCGLVLFSLAQAGMIRVMNGRPGKGESNFFSSLARVQNAARTPGRLAFVGSSVTGRLPDRNAGAKDVLNLGIDGGCAVDGLEAIDQGIVKVTGRVVIETNTLRVGLHSSHVKVSGNLSDPAFKLGLAVPQLSYEARPTGMLYRWMRSSGSSAAGDADILLPGQPGPIIRSGPPASPFPLEETARIDEMEQIISRLKARGIDVVFVQYPPAHGEDSLEFAIACEISKSCQVPVWDLGSAVRPGGVGFSDGVHLNPSSAAAVVAAVVKELDRRP